MNKAYLYLFISILAQLFQKSFAQFESCAVINGTLTRFITANGTNGNISWTASGFSPESFGCIGSDPNAWNNGIAGSSFVINFIAAVDNPVIRVWGMNTDDIASVKVNGMSFSLSSSTASLGNPVLCNAVSGGGMVFINGNLTGSADNIQGNYSYQDLTLNAVTVSSITFTTISGLGFGIIGAGNCSMLPVTFITLAATATGVKANLYWKTATEINSSHYIVECSADGSKFNSVGVLASKNNSAGSEYYFTCNTTGEMNFFRIKSIDLDGKFTYSKITRVDKATGNDLLTIASPFSATLTLQKLQGGEKIYITNGTGVLIEKIISPGNSLVINTSKWPNSVYYIQTITRDGIRTVRKVLKV